MGKKNQPKVQVKQAVAKKKPAAKSVADNKTWVKWIFLGGILLLTFLVFSPALSNLFTNWDDDHYVLNNPQLAKPVGESISYFFSNIYYSNYHPLTMILLALEYHSVQLHPALYHAVNIIIHLLNVMLVFWFIYLLSGKKLEVAVVAALLFGIHPMRVESVAWIAELKDVLYTFFFIGGLISYYKYIMSGEKKSIGLFFLTVLLFICSGLSKPAAVTFSLVLILLDFYTRRKFTIKVWLEKIPFLIISLIFGILTVKAQQHDSIGRFEIYSFYQHIMFASYALLDYIVKLFLPINLSNLYPYPHFIGTRLPYLFYFTPFIALALVYIIYRTLKYSRLIAFGFLFYFVNIMLVIQFVSVGMAITSDRYSYVPYICLFFLIGMGFSWLYNYQKHKVTVYRTPAIVSVVVVTIILCVLTNTRSKVWYNSDTLWTDMMSKYPDDAAGYRNHGVYLVEKSKYDIIQEPNDFELALKEFDIALNYKQDDKIVYYLRANIFGSKGQYDKALADYNSCLNYDSLDYEVFLNRGITYSLMKKYDSAIMDFSKALKLHGMDNSILNSRAYAYLSEEKYKDAIADYDMMIKNTPGNPELYFIRGYALLKSGDFDGALNNSNKAIELKPGYKEAYYNRAQTYSSMGKYKEALYDALKAQSLGYAVDPGFIEQLRRSL